MGHPEAKRLSETDDIQSINHRGAKEESGEDETPAQPSEEAAPVPEEDAVPKKDQPESSLPIEEN
jgi:hypothetical protein